MEFANYQLDWPRENLSVRCFVHDVFNYRYHWHEDEYELNILLHGRQECCRGSENFHLDVDDVILVPPGVGHASMGSQVDTIAFVLHFSASAFKPLLKKGGIYDFPSCRSDETTRDEPRYRHLRFYASQIFQFAQQGGPYAQPGVKASLELLLLALCTEFSPTLLNTMPEDEQRRAAVRRLLAYVSDHYAEKLTLENLADYAQYNRTYISTLFKQNIPNFPIYYLSGSLIFAFNSESTTTALNSIISNASLIKASFFSTSGKRFCAFSPALECTFGACESRVFAHCDVHRDAHHRRAVPRDAPAAPDPHFLYVPLLRRARHPALGGHGVFPRYRAFLQRVHSRPSSTLWRSCRTP